jgi:hypothetical protein
MRLALAAIADAANYTGSIPLAGLDLRFSSKNH